MRLRSSILVAFGIALGGCASVLRKSYSEARPFSYFGKISVGVPAAQARGFRLPILASGGDLARNSGIIPWKVESQVRDRTIDVTIYTTLSDGKDPSVSGTDLPALPAGDYDLVYRDPDGSGHPLGRVIIPKP